jgi:hypothetical protein
MHMHKWCIAWPCFNNILYYRISVCRGKPDVWNISRLRPLIGPDLFLDDDDRHGGTDFFISTRQTSVLYTFIRTAAFI